MLADAVDGVLSAEDQQFFDAHIAGCGPCEQLLAGARRGAAWLEMLRTPAPEPPPALLEKILAQTSGTMPLAVPMQPAMAPGYTNVLPFPRRAAAAMRGSGFGRIVFEPRLAMTAAMAFLSIALTMDLMGVNPMELRARDVSPSGLHRTFAQLDARVVQYYEGMRVVYELESRVHDFQNVQENANDAAPAQDQNHAPAASGPASSEEDPQAQPAGGGSSDQIDQPEQDNQDKAAPEQQQQPHSQVQPKAAPNSGVSRRDEMRRTQTKGTLAAFRSRQDADWQAAYDAALDDATQDDSRNANGGISRVVYGVPLQSATSRAHASGHAERRAA
jgi:hypothetical protein